MMESSTSEERFLIEIFTSLAKVREIFIHLEIRLRNDPNIRTVTSAFDIRHPAAQMWLEYWVHTETTDDNFIDWVLNVIRVEDLWEIESQVRRRLPNHEYDDVEIDFPSLKVDAKQLSGELIKSASRLIETQVKIKL